MHADAPIIVDGTLLVNGEKYDSTKIYFKGDRLDDPYKNFPAGWPGIYFRGSSRENILNWAVIQNAYQGIVTEQPSLNTNARVTLNQCVIDNIYDAGILAIQSSVTASNCLISNCGKNVQLINGGKYQFSHCTVASFSSSYLSHKEPVLFVSNNLKQNNVVINGLNAETLTMLRTRFILDWNQTYAKKFPFRLFERQEQYLQEGLFPAYNQWIFGASQNLAGYQNWISTHAEEYAAFNKFQQVRIFKVPDGQYYH